MRKFIAVTVLMAFVLSGCANITKEKKAEAQKFPENLLIDTFTGSICNGKVNVEITITTAFLERLSNQFSPVYLVFGKFRSIDSQKQTHETYLRGKFSVPSAPSGHYWRSDGMMSLYASKPQTLKELIEYIHGTSLTGQMAYEAAKKDKKTLAEFEKHFGSPPFGNEEASQRPTLSLSMDIARDAEGKGWVGSFVSEGFDDCHEIVLASKNGKNTSRLPLVTGDAALRMLLGWTPNIKEDWDTRRLYWLKVAEQKGHIDAPFQLAQFYEKQGKKSSQSYQQAFQYYRAIAEKANDQRAQMALANMYAEGRGTPVNPAEAKKWRDLANITLREASKVCTSPEILKAAQTIYQKEDGNAQVLAFFASVYTGMTLKPGTMRISEIVVGNVITMEKPFECIIYGEKVGQSIDASSIPNVEYYAVDGYGNYTYQGNNSGFQVFANMAANFGNSLANRPFNGRIKIEPLGGMLYKLKISSQSFTLNLQTGKINNAPQESPTKQELPYQKEQQVEQNPKIDAWAKDYFNKQ